MHRQLIQASHSKFRKVTKPDAKLSNSPRQDLMQAIEIFQELLQSNPQTQDPKPAMANLKLIRNLM